MHAEPIYIPIAWVLEKNKTKEHISETIVPRICISQFTEKWKLINILKLDPQLGWKTRNDHN